ncbi:MULTISPECIES: hypothetical protein [unclassified Mesorhizobium]|uniref:hypothetical protein n=1 Tax=unclassified Mesorhizobium TaxID=325217 RepID=UPI0033383D47
MHLAAQIGDTSDPASLSQTSISLHHVEMGSVDAFNPSRRYLCSQAVVHDSSNPDTALVYSALENLSAFGNMAARLRA